MAAEKDEIGLREGLTFQGRITSVTLLVTVVVLAAACIVFIFQQWSAERRTIIEHHKALAGIAAEHAGADLADGRATEAAALARSLIAAPGVSAVFLLDAKGALVAAASDRGSEADLPPRAEDDASQVRRPLQSRDGRPMGELVILSDLDRLGPLLIRSMAVVLALFFGATGLAMLMSRWLTDRLMRPINTLTLAMRGMAEKGDYTQRAPALQDAMFGRLTDGFNELMDKLQANDRALRHTLRELTVARDAAETANVLKSQFLANMSHEIRTPLNGVLAMAQVMEMSALDAGQRERLAVIRHSGEALLAVLNDVLDLSKIEAGKLELEAAEFDAGEITRSVALSFATAIAKKGLAFTVEVSPAAEGMRRGDPGRLRQILNNLVSNAVKFTAAGAIRIRCDGLGEGGADGLCLSVDDTGIGIAADKLPLLFEKFTQVDNSNTRRFGGTGLGLAISRELATLMGGKITVRSAEGRGSSFQVELPCVRVAGGSASPDRAPQAEALSAVEAWADLEVEAADERAVRILAAEDNPTNQRVLKAVLDTFGVEVTLVENGQLAVSAWESGDFDLILMDIQMPEMDGVAATRAIRRAEAAQGRPRTPIVALSANAMTHQVSEYLAAGMDAHVAKPIEIPRLQAVLEDAVSRSAEARAAA
jgi:two-component system, sensor histidine kinase